MGRLRGRRWRRLLPLAAIAVVAAAIAASSLAAQSASAIRLAIMSDCKGAFGGAYELDIGGAEAALAQYAHGKPVSSKKPSAGMTGITIGGHPVKIVGFACGHDTVPVAISETKRLLEQLTAGIMIDTVSAGEAVTIAPF